VIAERLGRLSPEWRRTLEIAGVEGDSFSAEVVARVLGAEPAWLVEGLSGFMSSDSRLVHAQGVQPLAEGGQLVSRYRFSHVLFRDYLYTHLDAVRRAHLHSAVGLGQNRFFSGDAAGSISDFRQALALYDRPQHAPLFPWTDGDLGVRCLGLLALALCYVGCADQGRSCSRQALARAQELAHPLTEAVSLTFAGCGLSALIREAAPAGAYARRLTELSAQKHLPVFRPYGLIYDSWVQVLGGAGSQAITQIRTGLAAWQAMGHRSGTPFLLSLLAQALQYSGAWDEALSTVEQGLALAAEIGAPHRPDLYRLKGELLKDRQPSDLGQVEACLRTAVTEAQQRGAKLVELRASVSLARLWRAQGRRDEARELLAGIYGIFTEGFDTMDLVEAKALLDELVW
jgi:tetratricopeptide (TPR) repeat protein